MSRELGQNDPLIDRAAEFLDSAGVPRGAGIVVGVSGGADSVALVAALRETAREGREYRLTVAHLNHKLRPDADADESFVAALAERWALPCVRESRDVAALAAKLGQGIEQAGRMLRYEFLRETAEAAGAAYVAVAHHADDNVETILYRLARGTHLRGLVGIPAARPLEGGRVMLIRPLLVVRREEIEAFCRRQGLAWRTDSTNASTDYRRNFIRHELLPLLREKLNPRVDEAVLRLAAAAEDVEGLLAQQAEELLKHVTVGQEGQCRILSAAALAAAPPLLATYALRAALERMGVPMRTMAAERFEDLRQILAATPVQALTLPGGFLARRRGDQILLEHPRGPLPPAEIVAIQCPGRTVLDDGREILCEILPHDDAAFAAHKAKPTPGVEFLDADQLRGDLVCRPRRDGDAFVPLGSPGRQTVGDFLTNLKLPAVRRQAVRCLCDEVGIVYLAPLRLDDRVKLTAATRRVLRIQFR